MGAFTCPLWKRQQAKLIGIEQRFYSLLRACLLIDSENQRSIRAGRGKKIGNHFCFFAKKTEGDLPKAFLNIAENADWFA